MSIVDQICSALLQGKRPYAVLLYGQWGVGKTHLWQNEITQTLRAAGRQPLYISLFGVQHISDYIDLIIDARLPLLKSTTGKGVKIVVETLTSFFRVDRALGLRELWRLDPQKDVLCVDDLERCDPAVLTPVLGRLAQLNERDGIPLLLIGNEIPLLEHPEYPRIKEKLIGHSFACPILLDKAVDIFVRSFGGPTGTFLESHAQTLVTLLQRSEAPNLRAARIGLEKFARLHQFITSGGDTVCDVAMSQIMRLVVGVALETSRDAKFIAILRDGLARLNWPIWAPDGADVLARFQRAYFEPWRDTPPKIYEVVDYVATGAIPDSLRDSVQNYSRAVADTRLILSERVISLDPSLQREEIRSGVEELMVRLGREVMGSIYEVLEWAELLDQLIQEDAATINTIELAEVCIAAIERVAQKERSDDDVQHDAVMCELASRFGDPSEWRQRIVEVALSSAVGALRQRRVSGIKNVCRLMNTSPHGILSLIEREYLWLMDGEHVFGGEFSSVWADELARSSVSGIREFRMLAKARAAKSENQWGDVGDLRTVGRELEGLLAKCDSAMRRIAIRNTMREVARAAEEHSSRRR